MVTTTPTTWIQKTPGVMGGEACIRRMRMSVWLLVEARDLGFSDQEQIDQYEGLTSNDLTLAWKYAEDHPEEISAAIERNNQDVSESGILIQSSKSEQR